MAVDRPAAPPHRRRILFGRRQGRRRPGPSRREYSFKVLGGRPPYFLLLTPLLWSLDQGVTFLYRPFYDPLRPAEVAACHLSAARARLRASMRAAPRHADLLPVGPRPRRLRERRALAGDDQPPRFVRMDHAKSETAFEFLQCSSNSIHEVQP